MSPRVLPVAGTPHGHPPGSRSTRPAVLDAARTALIPLRPLTIGEVLDGGFVVVRRNARAMLGLPLVIAGGTAAYALFCLGAWVLLGNLTEQWVQITFTVLAGLAGLFLLVQVLVWMTAILSRVSLQTVLGDGFAPSVSRVTFRTSLPMFWPVFGLSMLQYVAAGVLQTAITILSYVVLIPMIVLGGESDTGAVVAGVALSVITFLLSALALAYLALTIPALAVEGRTAPAWIGKPARPTNVLTAFERSARLIAGRNLIRASLVMGGAMVIAIGILALAAVGSTGLIIVFVMSIGGDFRTVLSNPYTIAAIIGFAVVVAMSALLAYVSAVTTLLYLDLRMRREALDMALRFDCVPLPQPSAPPAPVPQLPPAPIARPLPPVPGRRP